MDIVNTEITHSLHLNAIQTDGAVIVAILDLTIKNNRNVMVTVYYILSLYSGYNYDQCKSKPVVTI